MILITQTRVRTPIQVKELPALARYYRFISRTRAPKAITDALVYRPLRKLFPVLRGLGVLPHDGVFTYDRHGKVSDIKFDARNMQYHGIYSEVYANGYEQDLGLLMDSLLPEGGTFYDIGSNWGYFSLYLASRNKTAKIHAFEPFPNSFRDLQSCVEQAGISGQVTCHKIALSSTDGESAIDLPDGLLSGRARIVEGGGATRIATRRLDGMQLGAPDFMKIDVEGHEAEVLKGALATLKSAWPFIVLENIRDYSQPEKALEPLRILESLGYRLCLPAVLAPNRTGEYLLPCGWQLDIRRMQEVPDKGLLALAPLDATSRFLFQNDINVFACHPNREAQLHAVFKPWPAPPK